MKSAKKSISSLWKVTKERLSAILTKPQKEKEKNLQSTVREKRFSSSKPEKETSDPDKEIFEDIQKIKFGFGDQEPTVGEAGVVFVHEIGLENRQVYVIVLSDKFGTIIFYLPEELTEKIADRVKELPISFDNYLYKLLDYKPDSFEFTYAMAHCGYTVEEAADALIKLSNAMKEKYTNTEERSNNWRKLHGYPMRRKKGKRKHE
ncbi:hypothetical protein [Anaerocolumna xylanovorans]|uniref:Uncharacterized protein n=1 Tax=Anaerocolumna xylanovorans DSM 12503 TaxID=1121345 RepID=A0A1M7YBX3_9FIRM|nr:hypothetical protein [Anaerocolumna xylanovorans]SHO50134.1 hypothetical protein SAMN02745217_02600 [Anaerocolumna xylanovorans DSM 12503]